MLAPRYVDADVYQTLQMRVRSIVELLRGEVHPTGPRLVIINGQTIHTDLRRVPHPPHDVLEALAAGTRRLMAATPSATIPSGSLAKEDEHSFAEALRRPFRLEGKEWGAYGRLASETHLSDQALLHTTTSSGPDETSLPAFRGGFLVLALATEEGKSSDVWTLRFAPTFNPLAMVGTPGQDVPGIDLPGFTRYPGSRRIVSLTELSHTGETHLLFYEGSGSVLEHLRYFDALFLQNHVYGLQRAGPPIVKHDRVITAYAGKGQHITVCITTKAGTSGRVLDMLQVRLPARGE